jgi:phage portal protein BeeE
MADLSRKIGSAFGRLQAEMVQPVLQRVVYLLTKQGRIEIPTVNGRQVKIKSVSPLAQAQSNQDIVSLDRFLEMVAGRFGPEVINLLVSSEETAIYLAKKFGVPDMLIRDVGERQRMVQMAQQMQQQTGIDPNANPSIQALGG